MAKKPDMREKFSSEDIAFLKGRILNTIRDQNPAWVNRRILHNIQLRRQRIKTGELDTILMSLTKSGQIEEREYRKSGARGRPTREYRFLVDLEDEDVPLPVSHRGPEPAQAMEPIEDTDPGRLLNPLKGIAEKLEEIGGDPDIPSKDRVEALKQAADVHYRGIKILQSLGSLPNADRRIPDAGPLHAVPISSSLMSNIDANKALIEEAQYIEKNPAEKKTEEAKA